MSKPPAEREKDRLEDCKKSLEIIEASSFNADVVLEQIKALTLRWYLNGETDGIDSANSLDSIQRQFEDDFN